MLLLVNNYKEIKLRTVDSDGKLKESNKISFFFFERWSLKPLEKKSTL